MPKILAIDDKRDNLTALAALLKALMPECSVIVAQSGPEGIEKAQREQPDTILLDIHMPGMDGFETCRRLKADERTRHIPVVMITAVRTDGPSRIKGLEAGADAFLSKPVDEQELVSQLKVVLRIKAAEDALRAERDSLEILVRERTAELRESEATVRNKLDAILEPDGDIGTLELADILDPEAMQAMIEEFYGISNIGGAILDVSGKVLASAGWQDICAKFHRVHPDAAKNCLESDLVLAKGIPAGTFRPYHCKNNMWDMATPIEVDGKHLGNIYIGQFFFDDEAIDYDLFREQARRYGFDETEYLAALDRVPHLSREKVNAVMAFYARLAGMISSLSYSRIKLSRGIAERKQAEDALRESEYFIKSLLESLPVPVFYKDIQGRYGGVNKAFESFFGQTREELIGKTVFDISPAELARVYHEKDNDLFKLSGSQVYESQVKNSSGELRNTIFHKASLTDSSGAVSGLVGAILDITERKQAEAEREKLQSQLTQAQKMESVGRLAGGVAHDFNNMLSVIIGHAEMALEQVDPEQPLFDDLQEVRKAAERSADLTRQLLTFARKQTIAPKVIDLNETVEGMLKMLRRLIGEDIDLLWKPGRNPGPVKLDPSQIDQILANLCVNARDAIEAVGKVTIETGAAAFDEAYCAEHAGFKPGEYALLAVGDNGCGMDRETMGHLFEPFFTTKEQGKGTGLGLATVYGAVKQNNGFIDVYSEPGQGTTFKIYLPRHAAKTTVPLPEQAADRPVERGRETILLVEDEPAILRMATMMLERLGYTVIAAKTPGEAIRLAHENTGRIDLLATDVVMPEMNGRDLAKNLLSFYPDLKRLFMSGYTADVIAHRNVLDEGVHFIQKPFSLKDLGAKVRDAMGE